MSGKSKATKATTRKIGYVLLDGCSDRPAPALNYTTPLEADRTPNLDRIARMGTMGQVITVRKGISPESDIAVFNMLGYSFAKGYPGRGVVESIGAGIEVEDGDLALRANFATASGGQIVDRRAGRDITVDEAAMLEEELNRVKLSDADFEFRGTIGHRAVVVIRSSRPLSGEISNTDPGYARVNGFGAAMATEAVEAIQTCKPLEKTAASKRAADLVNEFAAKSMKVLDAAKVNHERERNGKKAANMLIFRDAGSFVPKLPSFEERHHYKGVALVEMPAEVGIAILLKMKMVKVKDQEEVAVKANLFNRELKDGTVVYAHIKGPDEFGHDGDAQGKKKNIEKIDQEFFGPVGEMFVGGGKNDDARIAVSCDHSTPCILKMHSADPVPLLITGLASVRVRDTCRFTEKDAKKGSIGTVIGKDVMNRVLFSN